MIEMLRGYTGAIRGQGGTHAKITVSTVFRCTLCNTHRMNYADLETHVCTPLPGRGPGRGRIPKKFLTKHPT